jgi:hypothetical protein
MKRRRVWGVLIAGSALGLSALGGCGKIASAPSVGGETHWLEHCGDGESGFDCGPGLACVCGVCTAACTDDESCSGDGAVCAEPAVTAYADGCESNAPSRVCVASSDVVLTAAAPKPNINPNRVDGYCGDELFSTEVGCLSCPDVRAVLQTRGAEIEAKYNACTSAEDCTIVTVSNSCDQTCGAAVNRANLNAYASEMGELGAGYCRAPARWPEHCGVRAPDCRTTSAACDEVNGRCYVLETPDLCRGRPLDQCADEDCTVASGRLYDVAGQCFSARSEAMGCVRRSAVCPIVPAPAVDAAGNCYMLDDECIPDTFQQAPRVYPCSDSVGKTCGN